MTEVMQGRDPHQSLKSEVIGQVQSLRGRMALARLQWAKNEVGYSLHVDPSSWSTAGLQTTDFLSYLGFQSGGCPFSAGQRCFSTFVAADFDLKAFAPVFDEAFNTLLGSQRDLEACGFFFNQPEGWGYFFGRRSGGSHRVPGLSGDGHTAAKRELMKQSEDEVFRYKFTWLEGGRDKGWVTHYRPKHPPLSSELASVFSFLGMQSFDDCPEFEFEQCHWRSVAFSSRGAGPFDSNAQFAHGWFDAHSARFSSGIQKLLAVNAAIEKVGLRFLPFERPILRISADVERRTARPVKSAKKNQTPDFDVAITFAGTERPSAEQLAQKLRDAGYSVFYDDFYPEFLWGKNLVDTFDEIYRKRARYCVMFVSKEYRDRAWTNHERQSAQARALQEKGSDYILPIRVDDTDLPGMPPTVGYVPLSKGINEIAELLLKKLKV